MIIAINYEGVEIFRGQNRLLYAVYYIKYIYTDTSTSLSTLVSFLFLAKSHIVSASMVRYDLLFYYIN